MILSPTSPTNFRESRRTGLPDIAFVGKAGAGKTTAASLLVQLGYARLSFAAPLKRIAADIWGDDASNDRDKLQKLGVAVRVIDRDAWVNMFMGTFYHTQMPVAVDDCRFVNEYWRLQGAGFVCVRMEATVSTRIDRLKRLGKLDNLDQLGHESETALDHVPADYTIKNDAGADETDLYDRLAFILKKEQRKR